MKLVFIYERKVDYMVNLGLIFKAEEKLVNDIINGAKDIPINE